VSVNCGVFSGRKDSFLSAEIFLKLTAQVASGGGKSVSPFRGDSKFL